MCSHHTNLHTAPAAYLSAHGAQRVHQQLRVTVNAHPHACKVEVVETAASGAVRNAV